jgi:UDP-4-amino-4,6-dideoxy-N-acetyl-beta-L-altrosamine transaminase
VKRTLPYGRQWIDDDDVAAVVAALRSDRLTTGPKVAEFEANLAEEVGAKFAVAVSSGTAALHLACLAAGVGPGDVVISSPNTFAASVNCALYCGARPVFADIDPATLNLDPGALACLLDDRRVEGRPRAVIPVHFAGQPCAMEEISAAARGMTIIEDACHALGASWRDRDGRWQSVGNCSHSDMVAFSFHPVKHITTAEGGAIATNRTDLYERLKGLRNHGIIRDRAKLGHPDGPWYYEIHELGFNYRLSDLQCALGVSQLRKLDGWVARRRELAALYDRRLAGINGVKLPAQREGTRSSYHLYVVQVPQRAQIFRLLHQHGVNVQVHYPPVHLHPLYQERFGFRRGDFPCAEVYYESAMSLPLFPQMSDDDIEYVVDALRAALASL